MYMFNGCAGLSKIKGIENLNTTSVTSMENMFHYSDALNIIKF